LNQQTKGIIGCLVVIIFILSGLLLWALFHPAPTPKQIYPVQTQPQQVYPGSPAPSYVQPSPSTSRPVISGYVGNSRTLKFHRPDCVWAQRISPANRVYFQTREEAIQQGYIPCKVCNP